MTTEQLGRETHYLRLWSKLFWIVFCTHTSCPDSERPQRVELWVAILALSFEMGLFGPCLFIGFW